MHVFFVLVRIGIYKKGQKTVLYIHNAYFTFIKHAFYAG